jgi:hypothetical protein
VAAAGRAGLAARGAVYLVVAALAVSVARRGDAEQSADTAGALAALGDKPYGQVLLWVLAAGLLGYAAWRAAQGITGRTSSREDAGAWPRLASAVRAAIYVSLALAAIEVATAGAARDGAQQQESWTAKVLGWPGGRWIVGAVGVGLLVAGAVEVWSGATGGFMKRLRQGRLGNVSQRVVRVAGGLGHGGRGAAYALVGWFVIAAAVAHDASKSRGLDGALAELAGRSYGPPLLLLLAVGLAAFGVYSICEARWRRIRA